MLKFDKITGVPGVLSTFFISIRSLFDKTIQPSLASGALL
jgi:hypothetical protein